MKFFRFKYSHFVSISTLSTLFSLGTFASASQAKSTTFFCGNSQGVPATMAKTVRGNVPVIRWTSNHFSGSGYTPTKRCQIVSQKFQQFNGNGTLKYLSTGRENGMPVVCVAKSKGGPCVGTLFTLKSGQSPDRTLAELMSVRVRASGPLNETNERVYVDMAEYLESYPTQDISESGVQPGQEPVW